MNTFVSTLNIVVILVCGQADQIVNDTNEALRYLKQGDASKAVDILEEQTRKASEYLDLKSEARIWYNYGKALQATDEIDEAINQFTTALEKDPDFDLAASTVFRVFLDQTSSGNPPSPAWSILGDALDQNRLLRAHELLQITLATGEWSNAYSENALPELVDYFERDAVTPHEFESKWMVPLRAARKFGEEFTPVFDDFEKLYLSPNDLQFTESEYGYWELKFGSRGFEMLGRLATSAAAGHEIEGNELEAMSLYRFAWQVDRSNLEPVLNLINLLLPSADEADVGNLLAEKETIHERMLDELQDEIFEAKSFAYKGSDWKRALQFHVLLGTVYERLKTWGSSYIPRSAIFQWEHAISAQESGMAARVDLGVFLHLPGIHEKLGDAYKQVGDTDRSRREYSEAIRIYAGIGRQDLSEQLRLRESL